MLSCGGDRCLSTAATGAPSTDHMAGQASTCSMHEDAAGLSQHPLCLAATQNRAAPEGLPRRVYSGSSRLQQVATGCNRLQQ
eukprot:14143569-Alexandrium_andersonii.AAC.1